MSTPKAVGVLELSSIGVGYRTEDDMLKAASVELLIARTICSNDSLERGVACFVPCDR